MGPLIRVSKILAAAKGRKQIGTQRAIGPTRRRRLTPKKLGSTKAARGDEPTAERREREPGQ